MNEKKLEKLTKLKELLDGGILTQEEFDNEKSKILAQEDETDIEKPSADESENANEQETETSDDGSDEEKKGDEDEEDSSWIKGCVSIVLIGLAIWGMVHFNPSEADHHKAIDERFQDATSSMLVYGGSDNVWGAALEKVSLENKLKYHSIGVCSWTTSKCYGSTTIPTIGILGWTCPLFSIGSNSIEYYISF